MLSNKIQVSILTKLLRAHEIEHIVLCPGSRDIPLVHNITADPYFKTYAITDERSASFFALGLCLQTSQPCAIVCTSGSALLNMHSAISEAYYQKVPLIVISADRSGCWIDQMDGQTLRQHQIFNNLCKSEVNLPEIRDLDDQDNLWYCERLVNEALVAAKTQPFAPVHLNVPIGDPFFDFSLQNEALGVHKIEALSLENALDIINHYHKRLIIIGQHQTNLSLTKEVFDKLQQNFILYYENLANFNFNDQQGGALDLLLLNDKCKTKLAPDLIISIGGHIISKRLKQYLRTINCCHIQISDDINLTDTFKNLRYKVTTKLPAAKILEELATKTKGMLNYEYVSFIQEKSKLVKNIKFPYSQMAIINAVMQQIKEGEYLHLANSSTVRYAQLFKLKALVNVQCNRGINGIDGSISTAIGFASTTNKNNYILTGDLSFFYDINGLYHQYLTNKIKIILINNQGGEIFHAISGINLSINAQKYILAPHHLTAKYVAKTYNLDYLEAFDEKSLNKALNKIQQSNKACILECFTSQDHDIKLLKNCLSALKGDLDA